MTAPPLIEAIHLFRANDVGTMIRLAGVVDVPKSKDEKSRLWAQLIGQEERVKAALRRVNPRCRKALDLLRQAGGELRTARFRTLLAQAGISLPESKRSSRDRWYAPHPEDASDPATFEEILAALLKWGLIWTHTLPPGSPASARLGYEGGRYVYVPQEVAVHLPPLPPRTEVSLTFEHVLSGSARVCQRDLYLLWSVIRETPFQLTNAGLVRVSDLKRCASKLLVSESIATGAKELDYRRIFFLRRLLTALGLVKTREENGAIYLEAGQLPAFFSNEPVRRVQESFQAWRDGAWWNELWNTKPAQAVGTPTDFAPRQVVMARRKVLDVLAHFSRRGEEWIALEVISEHLRQTDEEFLIDRATAESDRYAYYAGQSPYVSNALQWIWPDYNRDEDAGWDGVEEVFIRSVITEGLYWLGLVDLGYLKPVTAEGGTAPDAVTGVRLNEMGRWLLLNEPVPQVPAESGRVVVQPNFRIFAFDPIADSVLARLDSFAVRLNAERAIEFELTRESVYRAQQAGQDVASIRAWLEQITAAPLPQNISRSLEEWQAAYQRIIVRPKVGWVEVTSPELADAILADPDLSVTVIARPGPTSLLVHAALVDELEQGLLALGELPGRTSRAEDARAASIRLAPDGRVTFVHAMPSLYLSGYLQPLADQEPDGWRVTPSSVARAVAAGFTAPSIIRELAALAADGVPAGLQQRIKAWARHYGDARAETLTLVQFRDQEALEELLEYPELRQLLVPFQPAARLGLARVDGNQLTVLRKLLAEHGVELDG